MSCEFFKKLKPNCSKEELQKALLITVVESEKKALYHFMDGMRDAYKNYGENIPDDVLESIFIQQTNDIMSDMENLFAGEEIIISRVAEAKKDASLIGLDSLPLPDFFHSGFVYALFWYGITGETPDPSLAVTINHSHAHSIDEALSLLSKEFETKNSDKKARPSQKSSLPYWILMLVIGFVIGTIMYSCS